MWKYSEDLSSPMAADMIVTMKQAKANALPTNELNRIDHPNRTAWSAQSFNTAMRPK